MGCSSPNKEIKPTVASLKSEAPSWVKNSYDLPANYAVGYAPVNFQGVYIQRLSALNQARSDLANSIQTHINSLYEQELTSSKAIQDRKAVLKIETLSQTMLNSSFQVDAYFDEKKGLYVLVKSPEIFTGNEIPLNPLITEPYSPEDTIRSRCYQEKVLQKIHTYSELYMGRPVWFYRPGRNGAVGIAEQQDQINFEKQKLLSLNIAKSNLAKRQQTSVRSEQEVLKLLHNDSTGRMMETNSRMQSASKADQTATKDIWIDPNSCELYTWVIKEK